MDSGLPGLSQEIRNARIEAKLTREELSERIGVTAKSIQRYEEGKQVPRVSTLGRLASVLGISVANMTGLQNSRVTLVDIVASQQVIMQQLGALTEAMRNLAERLPPAAET